MAAKTKTIITTTRKRSLEQDMTAEERMLFESGVRNWGGAGKAADRGARYLDRVMPGWADRVTINELDLGDGCQCVLGQIFGEESRKLFTKVRALRTAWINDPANAPRPIVKAKGNGVISDVSSGFSLGTAVLDLNTLTPDQAHDAESFFGFDYYSQVSYSALTKAWKPLIEARQTAKT